MGHETCIVYYHSIILCKTQQELRLWQTANCGSLIDAPVAQNGIRRFSEKKKRFNLIWSWKETSSHLQIVTFSGFSGYIDVTFPRYSSVSLAAHAAMSVCVMFVLILRWAVSQCVYVTTLYCFSAPTFNTMSFHFILDEEVKEWKRWRKAYVLNASSSHTTHPTATLR